MEPPQLVYLKENCQLTPHKNSMQIQCMLPEYAKTPFLWYGNLILYPVFHLRVRHILTTFLFVYRSDA